MYCGSDVAIPGTLVRRFHLLVRLGSQPFSRVVIGGADAVIYALEATGPGAASRQQHHTNVVDRATATPEPTPESDLLVIPSSVVSPVQIAAGACAGVSWSVGGGTTYSRILSIWYRSGCEMQARALGGTIPVGIAGLSGLGRRWL